MIQNLKLGIRDIIKNIKFILLVSGFTISIGAIITSSTGSIYSTIKESGSIRNNSYVVVDNDISDFETLKKPILNLLKDGGYSYYSSYVLEPLSTYAFVLIGETSNALDENTIYYDSYSIQQQNISQIIELPFDYIDINADPVDFTDANSLLHGFDLTQYDVIVSISSKSKESWMPYFSIYEELPFLENFQPRNKAIFDEEITELLNDTPFQYIKHSDNEEIDFIVKYIYLLTLLGILLATVGYRILYKKIFLQLYREYLINYASGATLFDIFMRNSVILFVVHVIVLSALLFLTIGSQIYYYVIVIMYTFISLMLQIICLYRFITKKNLVDGLKGDFEI